MASAKKNSPAETPMMQQYRSIKGQHSDAILFFRLGDFYEMFFEDAREASGILGLTLTQRNGIPMCGIPYHASRSYIPRLLHAGKKIAVCEQTELPSDGKKLAVREVTEIISPGTITDQDFLDSGRDNYLVAVCRENDEVCIAWIDISTGRFEINSCTWDDSLIYLRQELARLMPKELIVQESLLNGKLASVIAEKRSWVVNRYPDWHFSSRESYRRLLDFFQLVNLSCFGISENDSALAPAGVLLDYVEQNVGKTLRHIRAIYKLDLADYLPLNEATQRNLELVCNLQDGGSEYSLWKGLNFCLTPMGSRTLFRWVLQPLKAPDRINGRLDRVSSLYHNQMLLSALRDSANKVRDLERLASKVGMGKCNPREAEAIFATLKIVSELVDVVSSFEAAQGLFELSVSQHETVAALTDYLGRAIADNPPLNAADGGCIRSGFDLEVDRLRDIYSRSSEIMQEYHQRLQESTGISSLKIKYNRILGYFIEVTKTNRQKVPDDFIPRQSLTQCDRFVTQELIDLQGELQYAEQNLVEREQEVFSGVKQLIEQHLENIQLIAHALGELDCIQSLAQAATIYGYVKPQVDDSCILNIEGGRHPVVERFLPPGSFVPNNVDLSDKPFALITGPNMAGKSTYLRQTALIVLMAQIGSFVPATSAHIGIADNIFCRVGARDNLAQGESTFLVEMNETAYILHAATKKSLIIMDEVGRGTSSTDGQAIAQAVCGYILNSISARTLFATHYHQLSQIEHEDCINLSMAVVEDKGKIVFLREIQAGPSNNSYGIQAARLAGIPEIVLAEANRILAEMLEHGVAELPTLGKETESTSIKENNGSDLFTPEMQVADIIRNTDTNGITPMQALQLLAELKTTL